MLSEQVMRWEMYMEDFEVSGFCIMYDVRPLGVACRGGLLLPACGEADGCSCVFAFALDQSSSF